MIIRPLGRARDLTWRDGTEMASPQTVEPRGQSLSDSPSGGGDTGARAMTGKWGERPHILLGRARDLAPALGNYRARQGFPDTPPPRGAQEGGNYPRSVPAREPTSSSGARPGRGGVGSPLDGGRT